MDTQTVTLKINDRPVTVPKGTHPADAAREAGVRIPTLCHIEGLSPSGACRICVVEVRGKPAASLPVLRLPRGGGHEHRHAEPARAPRPQDRSSSCCWPTTPRTASPA